MKKINEFLSTLPEELSNAIIKKSVLTVFMDICMLVIGIYFIFSNWPMTLLCFLIGLFLSGTIFYECYLIKNQKLFVVAGVCTSVTAEKLLKIGKLNYIIFKNGSKIYKCSINQADINKFSTGCNVSVYTTERNVYKGSDGVININSPLHVFVVPK